MHPSTVGKEKCAEKLNQMRKYLPFIDFMINTIKKRADTLPLESQLSKFQLLRSMIAERSQKHNLNVILRVEDVIEQLVVKLNYKDQNRTVSGDSTERGETEGSESRVKDTSTNNQVEVTSPVSPASTALAGTTAGDTTNQGVRATSKGDAVKFSFHTSRDNDVEIVGISEMAHSRKEAWSLIPIQDSSSESDNKDLDGYEIVKSHTNVSTRNVASSSRYSGFVTFKNPNYRSNYPERVTMYDYAEMPQLRDEKRDSNKRHSTEKYEIPTKFSRREVSPSESKIEKSRLSLTVEKSRIHGTEKDELSQNKTQKRKATDDKQVGHEKRKRVQISNLNDSELEAFVQENIQALPHLATLKSSEIRKAINSLGIETIEGPSSSSSENELQDLDEFVNDAPALFENKDTKMLVTKSSAFSAGNKSTKHEMVEGDNFKNKSLAVEPSEKINVSVGNGSIPKVTGDDRMLGETDFTTDTFDEFNPNVQSPKTKGLLDLPLPETDELYDGAPHMETAKSPMPLEQSKVSKTDQVEPSENVKNPVSVARRHSLHSTTVQSTSSYRTKDIVYGTWLASALPSHIIPVQGSIAMTQPNILLDPRLATASSSQSYHGMLNPVGNVDVNQRVANPRIQQQSLFSPPLVDAKPGSDGKISNPSHSSEAKSYAEYKRLKTEEMRKLRQKSPLSNILPKSSSESTVDGSQAGDKNIPKKTKVVRNPQHTTRGGNKTFRGGKTTTRPTQRRHSDYGDNRARLRENPNERAKKDQDKRVETDVKKTSPVDPEETVSPLDSLYRSEPKPQTGRGYGLQHFKIPKKVQSSTCGERNTKFQAENKRKTNRMDFQEESTNINKHDVSSSQKEEESRDSSEQTTNKSKSDKDISRKKKEDKTSPESTINKNENDKDTSRKKKEDKTSPESTINKNENDKDTSRKRRGSRDYLQQRQGNRKVSRKGGKNRDNTEQTKDSNKDGRKVMPILEENIDYVDDLADKKENASKVEGKTVSHEATANTTEDNGTDGKFRCHETTANIEENVNRPLELRDPIEYTRGDGDTDGKLDSRETTAGKQRTLGRGLDEKSISCESTASTTEDNGTDGKFRCHETTAITKENDNDRGRNMDPDEASANTTEDNGTDGKFRCRETTANTRGREKIRDSNMTSIMPGSSNSREATANTTEDNGTDGKFRCHETIANTEEDDDNEVSNMELGGLEEGIELNVEKEFEAGKSSNTGSNDVEANKEREQGTECDSSIDTPVAKMPSHDNQELMTTTPAAPTVTKEWVETFVKQSLGSKSAKIVKVLEKIGQLSEKKLKTIEKIINTESDGSSSEDESEEERKESKKSASGRTENKNVQVKQKKKISGDKKKKSPSSETEKDETEGEAKEKEVEVNSKTIVASSEPLASTSYEGEPKQSESSVTNAKKRARRGKKRRVGMDFVTRKKHKKTPRKQKQKQLLGQPVSDATQPTEADTGNLISVQAQKPRARAKPKGKIKTELDRLHDDIRSMFIGADVVAATGQRTCRLLKEGANNTNNSDIRESARPMEEQLRRESAQGSSRKADEINPGPVVEEYHKSTQWPRIVMQKIDLENFGYGQKISDTCVTFSRQTGKNKAIRSRNIGKEKPAKDSTKKVSKGKKKPATKKSLPVGRAQTEHRETRERSETEGPRSTTTKYISPVRVSSGEREETVEGLDSESLLNYALERRKREYGCKLCSFVSEEISDHYWTKHPESEVLISRLSRTEAADALREAAENDFEDGSLEDTPLDMVRDILLNRSEASSSYYCRMCNLPRVNNVNSFYAHVSEHTGEDKYKCPRRNCKVSTRSRMEMKLHINTMHYANRLELYARIKQGCCVPAEFGCLFGFICSRCNFVQIRRENLKKHVERKHGGDKNIKIIKINLSAKNPPEENKSNVISQINVQRIVNIMKPSEEGEPNVEITGLEAADEEPENRDRLENERQSPNQSWVHDTGFRRGADGHEENEFQPFVTARLDTDIDVDDPSSYLLKPENKSEVDLEANLEMHFEGNSESNLEAEFETNPEPGSERLEERHVETQPEPEPEPELNVETQPQAEVDVNMVTQPEAHLVLGVEDDETSIDECADLGKFISIRGSDIIDPLESSDSMGANSEDSRGAESRGPDSRVAGSEGQGSRVPVSRSTNEPFVPIPSTSRRIETLTAQRPQTTVETLRVGPLQVHLFGDMHVVYECFVKGCLFSTRSFVIFEKHLKISHSSTKWNGNCQVCRSNVKEQRRKHWPTATFALSSALKHLKVHARQVYMKRTGTTSQTSQSSQNISGQVGCIHRLNLNVAEEREIQEIESECIETESESRRSETDNLYPQRPLLRVRNLLGDRLSKPKDVVENITQQDRDVSIVAEEPTCYTEETVDEDTSEGLMFTIEDVRSLNPEVASSSGIQYEEVITPVSGVRDQAKAVTGQPVIVRSCPTRQIAIRPDTSVLPIEVGHLQVVQAPVRSSSLIVSPLSSSSSVGNESVILGTLSDSSPVRIRSSTSPQSQAPRFSQPILISTPPRARPPTQIICPIMAAPTSPPALVPTRIVRETEPHFSTSSSDPIATVEELAGQSAEQADQIGNRRTRQVALSQALPPSRPGVQSEEDHSLHPVRSVLTFGNKTVKDSEIYEEMLSREKICRFFKCMATDCSFACNDQQTFNEHLQLHEFGKKSKQPMLLKKKRKVYPWQQCSYCSEVIVPTSALSQHVLNVHGHCKYQCAYCFYRAVSKVYMNIHQNLAHPEKQQDANRIMYKCRKFSERPKMHPGFERQARKLFVRPYICDQCGSSFYITQEFMDHLVAEHQAVTAYTCHICKSLCFKADRLIAHYRLHSYSTYQCCYCLHGTESEWEMVLHLCNFHFAQPPCLYKRAWTEGTTAMGHEDHLDYLKLITYEDVVSPSCNIVLDPDNVYSDSDDSQDVSSITAELGIRTEGEASDSLSLMQELASIGSNPEDVSVRSLLPNAIFSSEGESEIETVLISSGLSQTCRRESSATIPVENINMNVPIRQVPSEAVISQPMTVVRYDVGLSSTAQSGIVVEDMGRSQATTSYSNLVVESANITPTVTAFPPATHRLPAVLTQRPTAINICLPRERVTTAILRTRQVEEEPTASSLENIGEAEVSCDQQQGMVDPLQEEIDINVESNILTISDVRSISESNTEIMPQEEEVETVEISQEETQSSTHEVRIESDSNGDQDNEREDSNGEGSRSVMKLYLMCTEDVSNPSNEPETFEEASTSTNLPRTRYSSLRSVYRKDDRPVRSSGSKSTEKKILKDLTGEDLYKCGNTGCDFAAPNEVELRNHLVVCDHSRNFPLLTCKHCSKLFKLNDPYLFHLRTHGEKKLSCGLCSYSATLDSTIIRHLRQKHRCKQFKTQPGDPPKEGYLVYYPKNYKKEKQNFKENGYAPGDEDKLPLQAIYQVNVKCANCPYFTKVRSNMVRHLKIHRKSAETQGLVVPSTAPTNPVPCLEAKEKMFDKMTNLAASSQLAQAKERTAIDPLTPEDIAKLPQYVNEHIRYRCFLSDCNYLTVDNGMLRHHMKALHTEVQSYSCPHCQSTVDTNFRHVPLDKIGFHLRHHDAKLYKCAHCMYFHYQKVVVERHTLEKHPDRKYFVHTVREPRAEEESSSGESSTTVWRCGICNDFQGPSKATVVDHLSKIHGSKSLFLCKLCDMKSNHYQVFTSHFASKHPGEKISYFSTVIKDTSSSSESTAVSESTSDRFDTTPLWQRGASRVRHIRGILIDEDEEVTVKKSKKAIEHTQSTPVRTSARTTTTAPVTVSSPVAGPSTVSARPRSRPPPRSRGQATTSTPPSDRIPTPPPSPASARTRPPPRSRAPATTTVPVVTSAPAPASVPTLIPTSPPAPALAPSVSAALTLARPPPLSRAPVLITVPIQALTPASVSTSVPASVLVSTSTPAEVRPPLPGQTVFMTTYMTPAPPLTRAPVPPLTPVSTVPITLAPVPPLTPAPGPARASAMTTVPSPAPVRTSLLTSTMFPTTTLVRLPATALRPDLSCAQPRLRAPASDPVPGPSGAQPRPWAPTQGPSSTQPRPWTLVSGPFGSQARPLGPPSTSQGPGPRTRSREQSSGRRQPQTRSKSSVPSDEKGMVSWVNNIIEQQKREIALRKQTTGESENETYAKRRRRKFDGTDE